MQAKNEKYYPLKQAGNRRHSASKVAFPAPAPVPLPAFSSLEEGSLPIQCQAFARPAQGNCDSSLPDHGPQEPLPVRRPKGTAGSCRSSDQGSDPEAGTKNLSANCEGCSAALQRGCRAGLQTRGSPHLVPGKPPVQPVWIPALLSADRL